ncbi:hypothetical protein SS37A_39830 (plasmid) [Methylocystis iwaonis]|uniref:Uncharacterized protein n=2 Tax=Methylocystaceae TaxID=31993 RepID=A0ABM8EEH9_9HYPH|nr:hypothetical protein SS37A_39830 [Methylocystis iwaonis]
MQKNVKSALAAALCGATALAVLPTEVLAGPMTAAPPGSLGITTPVERAYYRGNRRGYYPGYGGYYQRGYGYSPGAAVAGAAAGLLGAGIAGASGYGSGYPSYGAGGFGSGAPYGGGPCYQWDSIAGWVWRC